MNHRDGLIRQALADKPYPPHAASLLIIPWCHVYLDLYVHAKSKSYKAATSSCLCVVCTVWRVGKQLICKLCLKIALEQHHPHPYFITFFMTTLTTFPSMPSGSDTFNYSYPKLLSICNCPYMDIWGVASRPFNPSALADGCISHFHTVSSSPLW